MKITVGDVRRLIREQWYLEEYDSNLTKDKSFKKQSVIVPDEIKDDIVKYLRAMRLAEASTPGFDLAVFRQIATVPEMRQYLKDHARKLGMGAARDAWDVGDGRVLKMGPDANAVSQNKREAMVWARSKSPLVPEVFEHDQKFRWILAEAVKPLRSEAEVNQSISESTDGAINDLPTLLRAVRTGDIALSGWFESLVELVKSHDINIDELHKGNWGINHNGTLVILDTGK